MLMDAAEFTVNEYSIDMVVGSDHPRIGDRVCVALPLDYLDKLDALFLSFIEALPFWGGVAGFGFEMVRGREYEQEAMPVMFRAAKRYHGLILRHRTQEDIMIKQLKTAGWLTFLDEELTALVGGHDLLNEKLSDTVSKKVIRGGILLRAGDVPPVGDVNRQDKDIEPMAEVNRAIRPIRLDKWFTSNLFRVDKDVADEWFSRLD